MGIAEKVKARQAKTYAKEDAVAPPDESCMAKIWRYFEVLLVVGPNIGLIWLAKPLWQGYKCPQIPSLYPIYIALTSLIVLNALLSAGVNIKRVFVDPPTNSLYYVMYSDKSCFATFGKLVPFPMLVLAIAALAITIPNFEYMNSLHGNDETCNSNLFGSLFICGAITVGIFALIFLIIAVIFCAAVIEGALGKGGNDDEDAETLEEPLI
ncbi:hypothetical protein THAOC_12071 [Thalassiosira oceanica]|uniref:Uncharacterized protein n=1 Tax=Thalassiosira oceanica TaxID=159749 RepID=K0SKV2_THAOC|nr:hypothetical protein THAOC_12071 [Thalassiosira oceanica]|eukprot:EJK66953.1 hypothetical protein THAOC_12071 [Thalassiosira oceanica]